MKAYVLFFLSAVVVTSSAHVIAQDENNIRIAMSLTPLSTPFIVAKNKGYFKEYGLNIQIKDYIGGNRTIQAVFDGDADLATSSEAVVMFNSFKRSDFTVIGTFVSSDNDVKIITRKDTGIKQVKDLVGHRIGTVKGASAEFFLDQTLTLNGIPGNQVIIVPLSPEATPAALVRGEVDAIAVWEPFPFRVMKQLGDQGVALDHDRLYIETFNAIVMRDYATHHQSELKNLLRALIKATKFISEHPEESQRIAAKRLGKDLRLIEATWGDFNFDVSLHHWLLKTLESQGRWAIRNKLVSNKTAPNFQDFLLTKLLKEVKPDSVTLTP